MKSKRGAKLKTKKVGTSVNCATTRESELMSITLIRLSLYLAFQHGITISPADLLRQISSKAYVKIATAKKRKKRTDNDAR